MSGASRQRFGAEEARYRGPHRTLTTGKGIPNKWSIRSLQVLSVKVTGGSHHQERTVR